MWQWGEAAYGGPASEHGGPDRRSLTDPGRAAVGQAELLSTCCILGLLFSRKTLGCQNGAADS